MIEKSGLAEGMEKRFITQSDGVQNEWYKDARDQNLESLPRFLSDMLDNYSHDQETIVHALTAGSIGTIAAMNRHPEGDLGQSQFSSLLGMFIRKWAKIEGPAKIMSWGGLLSPENETHLMGVPKEIAKWLSAMADKVLEEGKFKDDAHKLHLERVSKGEMPWGFRVNV